MPNSVKGAPLSSGGAQQYGRTAVCMTGFPRSLFARFPDDIQHGQFKAHIGCRNPPTGEWWNNLSWAGPPIPAYPDYAVAASFRNYVFNVLGRYGGYDLFIMVPGTQLSPLWDVLSPGSDSVNAYGAPNRMFLRLGGEEGPIEYDANSWRWKNFYASDYGATTSRHMGIQQFLWQIKSLNMCHEWVLEHAAAESMKYKYKMKLRPDVVFTMPIPPLHTLDAQFAKRIVYYQPGSHPERPRDSVGVGYTEYMDVYLSRFQHVFTALKRVDGPGGLWNAEYYPFELLKSFGITFTYLPGLQVVGVRMNGCGHGQGWNYSYSGDGGVGSQNGNNRTDYHPNVTLWHMGSKSQ